MQTSEHLDADSEPVQLLSAIMLSNKFNFQDFCYRSDRGRPGLCILHSARYIAARQGAGRMLVRLLSFHSSHRSVSYSVVISGEFHADRA